MKKSKEKEKLMLLRQALKDYKRACQVSNIVNLNEYKKMLDLSDRLELKLKEVKKSQIRQIY